jgi:hypothetical protein
MDIGGMSMSEIIQTPFWVRWQVPVAVATTDGAEEEILGPEEALNCLTFRWPCHSGKHFDVARGKCLAVLRKRARCEESREAFVSAALEAGVFRRS